MVDLKLPKFDYNISGDLKQLKEGVKGFGDDVKKGVMKRMKSEAADDQLQNIDIPSASFGTPDESSSVDMETLSPKDFLDSFRANSADCLSKIYETKPVVETSIASGTLSIHLPQDIFHLVETQLDLLDEYLVRSRLKETTPTDGLIVDCLLSIFRNISCKQSYHRDGFFHDDLETCVAAANSFLSMGDKVEELMESLETDRYSHLVWGSKDAATSSIRKAARELVSELSRDAVVAMTEHAALFIMEEIHESGIPSLLLSLQWENELVRNEVAISITRILEQNIAAIYDWVEQDFLYHKLVSIMTRATVCFYIECIVDKAEEMKYLDSTLGKMESKLVTTSTPEGAFSNPSIAVSRINTDMQVLHDYFHYENNIRSASKEFSILSLVVECMLCAANGQTTTIDNLKEFVILIHKETGADVNVTKHFMADIWRLSGPEKQHRDVQEVVVSMKDELEVFSSHDLKSSRQSMNKTNNGSTHFCVDHVLKESYQKRIRSESSQFLSTTKKEMYILKQDMNEFCIKPLKGYFESAKTKVTPTATVATLQNATNKDDGSNLALAIQLSMEEEQRRRQAESLLRKQEQAQAKEDGPATSDAATEALRMMKTNPSLRGIFSNVSFDDGDDRDDQVDKLQSCEEESSSVESSTNGSAQPFLASKGEAPSGTMVVKLVPSNQCLGFPSSKGVISICYSIPNGMQLSFQQNPGVKYDGFPRRFAYLPNTEAGRSLLVRFQAAFSRGFMFKVGRSVTFKLDNQTTWSTIPNKTSLRGGPFGFPDDGYIAMANDELDKLGVPNASECLAILKKDRISETFEEMTTSYEAREDKTKGSQEGDHDEVDIVVEPSLDLPSDALPVPTKKPPHPFLQTRGNAPSGTMLIKLLPKNECPGFPSSKGLISICYSIPNGTQLSFHHNPGVKYDGFPRRFAYLPNTEDGRCLLVRFKSAFSRGFMFEVGRSIAFGLDNQTTWSTIPNKTSLRGGPFGFPDDNYIATANSELDKLGVPSAHEFASILQDGGLSMDSNHNWLKKSLEDVTGEETVTYEACDDVVL